MRKPTVFISYSHSDSKFVNELAEKLKSSGVNVWIDKWKVKVGDSITGKINEGIGESDFLIVVLSRSSVESKWVKEEMNSALIRNIEDERHAFILPVLKDECEIPTLLQHRKYANLKDDPERGFQDLLEVLSPRKVFEPEMIFIPDGEFLMGSDPEMDKDAQFNEQPQHSVYVPEFYIGKYPVTSVQYKSFLTATGYVLQEDWDYRLYFEKYEDHPVVDIAWIDAMAYCGWLAEVTSKPYRLPTEAEWEKACRGTKGNIYPWGNKWDKTKCSMAEKDTGDTTPVGLFSPKGDSPYGCADMAGNVWEWCSSMPLPYPYKADDGREGETPPDLDFRVLRGGAFYSKPFRMRCANRDSYFTHGGDYLVGFRVALSLFNFEI